MPSLRLSELDELLKEDDELSEIELRRKKRKEKKLKSYGTKFIKPRDVQEE